MPEKPTALNIQGKILATKTNKHKDTPRRLFIVGFPTISVAAVLGHFTGKTLLVAGIISSNPVAIIFVASILVGICITRCILKRINKPDPEPAQKPNIMETKKRDPSSHSEIYYSTLYHSPAGSLNCVDYKQFNNFIIAQEIIDWFVSMRVNTNELEPCIRYFIHQNFDIKVLKDLYSLLDTNNDDTKPNLPLQEIYNLLHIEGTSYTKGFVSKSPPEQASELLVAYIKNTYEYDIHETTFGH